MERKKYRPNADPGDEKQPTSYQKKIEEKKNPVSINVCRTLNQMNPMRC